MASAPFARFASADLEEISSTRATPFYAHVATRLGAADAPTPRRVVLPVPFVRQHHMTCGAATLTMLARSFGRETSHEELKAAIATLTDEGVEIVGASDHGVTHSLYIKDPDGNELELYIDVQPETWRGDPTPVDMVTRPLVLR